MQIAVHPTAVRTGETADIEITWTQPMPADASLQWAATVGNVQSDNKDGYEYSAASEPGRAFIHLLVISSGALWAECAAPVQVYRQFVVLKADDLSTASSDSFARFLSYADALKQRGIKTSAGMIASLCQNPTTAQHDKITDMARSGFVEFWNHGYDHAYYLPGGAKAGFREDRADDVAEKAYPAGTTYEFKGRPYEEQLDHLTRAQQTILDTYGIKMRTFGAPFNETDANTAKALHDLGQIDIWYFAPSPDLPLHVLRRGGGEIEPDPGIPSLSTFLATHDQSRPLLVLQHHPMMDTFPEHWGEFSGILDTLAAKDSTFILPGEYVDLTTKGVVPADPKERFADPALESAVRDALNQWTGPIDPTAAASLAGLQYTGQTPRIRSLIGIGALTGARQFDFRGNDIADATPLVDFWRGIGGEMTVQLQGNPLSDGFVCNQVPLLDAQGLHIAFTGPCDNVALKLAVDGQGVLDPAAGDHAVPRNAPLTVHAKPSLGWKFASWEGAPEAVPGSLDLTITPATHRSITAHFVRMSGIPVAVDAVTNGMVVVTPAQPEDGYVAGTTVTVTATPSAGYVLARWTGALAGTAANPATLIVNSIKTVGAVFSVAPPANVRTAAQLLLDGFTAADGDHSGGLNRTEAVAAVPGLTQDQFSQLDANGDGQLTQDELNQILNPGGCRCGKADFTMEGLKGSLADIFLAGLAVLVSVAFSACKPRA